MKSWDNLKTHNYYILTRTFNNWYLSIHLRFNIVQHNFSSPQDNKSHHTKKQSTSIHFDNELEMSSDGQYKELKYRRNTLIIDNYDNSAAWEIGNLDKFMAEINNHSEEILSMILDIQKTYIDILS